MQNIRNRRSVKKSAQDAGSNVLKAGYKIQDPNEGHMHCDVIVLSRNYALTA